jgi:hypothetical protein
VTKGVHRHVTEPEKTAIPGAFTFNRAAQSFHCRDGFEISVPVELLSLLIKPTRRRKSKS